MSRTTCEPTGVIPDVDPDDSLWGAIARAQCHQCKSRLRSGSYSVRVDASDDQTWTRHGLTRLPVLRYYHHECYLNSLPIGL